MFGFKRRKMEVFYEKNKAFLSWYLDRHCNISEKLHHLLVCYFVECLERDIERLFLLSEKEQRIWIMMRIDEFLEKERRWG